MAKKQQNNIESSEDVRVMATQKIWGYTVGILALCIPLSSVTRSGPVLPLAALGGAAVSTVAIWRSDDKKSKSHYLPPQQLEMLQQRVADLETIVSSDEFDLQMKIKQLETRNINKPSNNDKKTKN
ncbi:MULTISPECIES: hypothetical protein [unclassified Anabaena]|uniref:hypothetical protein n=1 Tax=unclassified Anabaena TaxID=2619674 RepID=UPI0039C64B6B